MTPEGADGFPPVRLKVERRGDGTIVLANAMPLKPHPAHIAGLLAHWACERPDTIFLAERSGSSWTRRSYRQTHSAVRLSARKLLRLGLSEQRPLVTISQNSIAHAELLLAAITAGIPVAPVSPVYAAGGSDPERLRHIMSLLTPGAVFLGDPQSQSDALAGYDCPLIAGQPGPAVQAIKSLKPAPDASVEAATRAIRGETIAKFLFTSGSTGSPKCVVNTHRMLASNQQALSQVWPSVGRRPLVMLDWLPWSHTFGGNFCLNFALFHGGTLHIDDGRPLPSLVARTVENLRDVSPTVYFNVPAGFSALLPHLEEDKALTARFFGGVDFLFSASAALGESTRERLITCSLAATGRVPPILGGWGSTETAPAATIVYFRSRDASNLGVPLPGTEVKLIPRGEVCELAVRGPNVTPGYWRDREHTARSFDDEGFYLIRDAGVLIAADRPEEGISFRGRLAENFKLSSGTWVNVSAVRLAIIRATEPLVLDAVLTGEGTPAVGAILFLNLPACRALLGQPDATLIDLANDATIREHIRKGVESHNKAYSAPSTCIACFVCAEEPLSFEKGEITDKNYVNQRLVIQNRPALVAQLIRESC